MKNLRSCLFSDLKMNYSGKKTWISISDICLYMLIIFTSLGISSCSHYEKQNNEILLVSIPDTIKASIIEAEGAELEVINKAEGNALKIICNKDFNVPKIIIHEGKEKWQLSRFVHLAMDITNRGDKDVLIECRPRAHRGSTAGSGNIIPAGKTRTLRCYVSHEVYPKYLDEKFFGMFAMPGGIVRVWSGIHSDSIDKFSLALIHPPDNITIEVGNIRGEGRFKFLTEEEVGEDYFPLLDEFGQFRHKEWPGKTHSIEELKNSFTNEQEDIKLNPPPEDRDQFGGWNDGPQLEATGNFRTEKINGKWWLVDPEGKIFWSHGMDMSVTMIEQGTPISEREHYFSQLPDQEKYKEFYSERDWVPQGYFKNRSVKVFNRYGYNLFRKYGASWKKDCAEYATSRLKSWGMNTCHSWSPETILMMENIPYTAYISTRNSNPIEGSRGYWGKFPDPYDESFEKTIRNGLEVLNKTTSDPYCIGYFIDNEMNWGDQSYLASAVLMSGSDQPAKTTFKEFLRTKYRTIANLNARWATEFKSWAELMNEIEIPERASDDLTQFSEIIARKYFQSVKEVLEDKAPGKLYLGCRISNHFYPDEDTTSNWVIKIAADYCDILSFNRYRYSAIDLKPANRDKPIIIGEFHMGALDRGLLHYTLRYAENQEHRAELYKYYVKSCLENPFIVGAHWFEYVDEPTLGRFEGENFNTGFVDVCDRPYPEMVKASREIGKSLYILNY